MFVQVIVLNMIPVLSPLLRCVTVSVLIITNLWLSYAWLTFHLTLNNKLFSTHSKNQFIIAHENFIKKNYIADIQIWHIMQCNRMQKVLMCS